VAYITHPPALLLLGFGILTFLTMQIQLSAVHALRDRSSAEANSAIAVQSQSLGVAINQAMLQQSGEYATNMNLVIQGWQQDIDTTIFGPWLNTTTVALNTTLVEFYDKVEDGESYPSLIGPDSVADYRRPCSIERNVRTDHPRHLGQQLCLLHIRVKN